jgi:hypothetical protein
MSAKLEFAKFRVLLHNKKAYLTETILENGFESFSKYNAGSAVQDFAINECEESAAMGRMPY